MATPVTWEELEDTERAAFTIADVEKLLERARSRVLRGWGVAEQRLPILA